MSEDSEPIYYVPADFVDVYLPYLKSLLEYQPKGYFEIYKFSSQYFDCKVNERENAERKSQSDYSDSDDNRPKVRSVGQQSESNLGSVQPDYVYDSFMEFPLPSYKEQTAQNRSDESASSGEDEDEKTLDRSEDDEIIVVRKPTNEEELIDQGLMKLKDYKGENNGSEEEDSNDVYETPVSKEKSSPRHALKFQDNKERTTPEENSDQEENSFDKNLNRKNQKKNKDDKLNKSRIKIDINSLENKDYKKESDGHVFFDLKTIEGTLSVPEGKDKEEIVNRHENKKKDEEKRISPEEEDKKKRRKVNEKKKGKSQIHVPKVNIEHYSSDEDDTEKRDKSQMVELCHHSDDEESQKYDEQVREKKKYEKSKDKEHEKVREFERKKKETKVMRQHGEESDETEMGVLFIAGGEKEIPQQMKEFAHQLPEYIDMMMNFMDNMNEHEKCRHECCTHRKTAGFPAIKGKKTSRTFLEMPQKTKIDKIENKVSSDEDNDSEESNCYIEVNGELKPVSFSYVQNILKDANAMVESVKNKASSEAEAVFLSEGEIKTEIINEERTLRQHNDSKHCKYVTKVQDSPQMTTIDNLKILNEKNIGSNFVNFKVSMEASKVSVPVHKTVVVPESSRMLCEVTSGDEKFLVRVPSDSDVDIAIATRDRKQLVKVKEPVDSDESYDTKKTEKKQKTNESKIRADRRAQHQSKLNVHDLEKPPISSLITSPIIPEELSTESYESNIVVEPPPEEESESKPLELSKSSIHARKSKVSKKVQTKTPTSSNSDDSSKVPKSLIVKHVIIKESTLKATEMPERKLSSSRDVLLSPTSSSGESDEPQKKPLVLSANSVISKKSTPRGMESKDSSKQITSSSESDDPHKTPLALSAKSVISKKSPKQGTDIPKRKFSSSQSATLSPKNRSFSDSGEQHKRPLALSARSVISKKNEPKGIEIPRRKVSSSRDVTLPPQISSSSVSDEPHKRPMTLSAKSVMSKKNTPEKTKIKKENFPSSRDVILSPKTHSSSESGEPHKMPLALSAKSVASNKSKTERTKIPDNKFSSSQEAEIIKKYHTYPLLNILSRRISTRKKVRQKKKPKSSSKSKTKPVSSQKRSKVAFESSTCVFVHEPMKLHPTSIKSTKSMTTQTKSTESKIQYIPVAESSSALETTSSTSCELLSAFPVGLSHPSVRLEKSYVKRSSSDTTSKSSSDRPLKPLSAILKKSQLDPVGSENTPSSHVEAPLPREIPDQSSVSVSLDKPIESNFKFKFPTSKLKYSSSSDDARWDAEKSKRHLEMSPDSVHSKKELHPPKKPKFLLEITPSGIHVVKQRVSLDPTQKPYSRVISTMNDIKRKKTRDNAFPFTDKSSHEDNDIRDNKSLCSLIKRDVLTPMKDRDDKITDLKQWLSKKLTNPLAESESSGYPITPVNSETPLNSIEEVDDSSLLDGRQARASSPTSGSLISLNENESSDELMVTPLNDGKEQKFYGKKKRVSPAKLKKKASKSRLPKSSTKPSKDPTSSDSDDRSETETSVEGDRNTPQINTKKSKNRAFNDQLKSGKKSSTVKVKNMNEITYKSKKKSPVRESKKNLAVRMAKDESKETKESKKLEEDKAEEITGSTGLGNPLSGRPFYLEVTREHGKQKYFLLQPDRGNVGKEDQVPEEKGTPGATKIIDSPLPPSGDSDKQKTTKWPAPNTEPSPKPEEHATEEFPPDTKSEDEEFGLSSNHHTHHRATILLKQKIRRMRQLYYQTGGRADETIDDSVLVPRTTADWMWTFLTNWLIWMYQDKFDKETGVDEEEMSRVTPILRYQETGNPGWRDYFSSYNFFSGVRIWYFTRKLRQFQKDIDAKAKNS